MDHLMEIDIFTTIARRQLGGNPSDKALKEEADRMRNLASDIQKLKDYGLA